MLIFTLSESEGGHETPLIILIGANPQQNQVQLSTSPFAKWDSGGFVLADKVKSPPPPFSKGGEFVELQISTNHVDN